MPPIFTCWLEMLCGWLARPVFFLSRTFCTASAARDIKSRIGKDSLRKEKSAARVMEIQTVSTRVIKEKGFS